MAAAFAYTVEDKTVFGNKRVHTGTYTPSGGSTGGDIVTGLNHVDFISLQTTGSAVSADHPSANETFPLASGTVTIVTTANKAGIWLAVGH